MDTPTHPLTLGLWAAAVALEARLARELAPLGVTLAEFRLIGEVALQPHGVRQKALALRLGVTAPTVSAAVARLEQAGLLVRRPDPVDGRAQLVCLAPEAPLREGLQVLDRVEADLAAALDPAQVARLTRALSDALPRLDGTRGG